MKKIIILPLFVLFLFASCTMQKNVNNFYNKYQGTENTMSFKAPLFLASLMLDNDAEIAAFRNKIKSVKVLTMSDLSEIENTGVQSEVKNALLKDGFENWLNLNREGNVINVSAQNRGKSLKNLVVSLQGDDNLIFINAKTNLSERELTRFITKVLDAKEEN